MAIGITWLFRYYTNGTTTVDLTSYVRSCTIDYDAALGRAGRARATIVLNNQNGEFTPGGSGTYAAADWFKYAFEIQSKAPSGDNTYRHAFSGLVDNFTVDIQSIKDSTVTISLVDIMTVGGRSRSTTTYYSTILTGYVHELLQLMYNGETAGSTVYFAGVDMPYCGAAAESVTEALSNTDIKTEVSNDDFPAGRVGDWINNNLMVTGPGTSYTAGVRYDSGNTRFAWAIYTIDYPLNNTRFANLFTFADGSAALTSGQLPFTDIDVQYNFDSVINTCTARDQRSVYTATTFADTTSTSSYGVRTVEFNSTCTEQQADVDRVAYFWPNRYATPRYTVRTISTSLSALKAFAVDNGVAAEQFARLLTPTYGLWNRASVAYTAPGITSRRTEQLVISRVRIAITPADTRVSLDFVPGADNQSFELGSTTYGVLGTNKVA